MLSAGAFQFTAWKARHLACCRVAPGRCGALPERVGAAWRLGARFGFHCCCSGAGLTASLQRGQRGAEVAKAARTRTAGPPSHRVTRRPGERPATAWRGRAARPPTRVFAPRRAPPCVPRSPRFRARRERTRARAKRKRIEKDSNRDPNDLGPQPPQSA
ncbi:hypothetical protein [Burkholderia mayonis]|uniref:hypothetical protein n=1 Tax=Burkholderia mayonis TaxID=1385591 RepID=UPI003AAF3D47